MSIHTMWQNKEHGTEALHRATLESPGHQKIHIARKWGFTKVNADEFENMVAEQQLIPDGCGVKYIPKIWPSGQVVDPILRTKPEDLEVNQAIASSEDLSPLQKLESTVYSSFVLITKLSQVF
ncbi:hypothetical protein E5288_WYG002969 [Bos mutus]|uniref:Ribosomal protein L10e/L16 domain-containing protein n=1 Tax=Bos mutus TaxID=72004 RepID=A0A6B0SCL2_9CETA|nr:hypothetical protein [Bos mutus]